MLGIPDMPIGVPVHADPRNVSTATGAIGAGHHNRQTLSPIQLMGVTCANYYRRWSMRKTKEVLRLRFDLGPGQRAIARACSISQSTVMSI